MPLNETWKKWLSRVPSILTKVFGTATSDGSVAVALALRGQPSAPTATSVSRVVMDAHRAMFPSA